MHLQWLLPKGKRTEAERKLFAISEWSSYLLREIAQELKRAHQGRIPVVGPHPRNTKAEDLSPERYLFQWDASPDGKSGAFHPEDMASLLCIGWTSVPGKGSPLACPCICYVM
jgi:hypothetical protein